MTLPEPVPDLVSLDLLVTLGGGRSISEAARAHGITQPAASVRLRRLEAALGLQLLDRAPTGARLTPAGAAVAEWAGQVIADVEALVVGATALRNESRSHLRLAASLTVAEYLIPGWLQRLGAVAPEVGVSLQMGNTLHVAGLVASGDVDLGFVEGHLPPPGLRHRDIGPDDLVVVVGPGHPWARRRRRLTPAELASTPLVLREPGSGTREVLVDALGLLDLQVTVLVELGSTTAIKSAAAAGAGPAVLSVLAVETELADGQLVRVPCDGLRLDRTLRAVWSARRPPGPVADRLLAVATGGAASRRRAGTPTAASSRP